jgi:hypothetical protein
MSCALLLLAAGNVGCVERRMTIRTNVDHVGGAMVIVNNQEVGQTPLSTGFTYYADREIRLVKDGYETATFIQPMPAPPWDSLLVEFFVENLWPFTMRDEREYLYEMKPQRQVTTEEMVNRAQRVRSEAHLGAEIIPLPRSEGPASRVAF